MTSTITNGRIPPGPADPYKPSDNLLEWMRQNCQIYGDIYKASIYGVDVYVVNSADYAEQVLLGKWQSFAAKGQGNKRVALSLGPGLMSSKGERWVTQRRMIQPAFKHEVVAELHRRILCQVEMQVHLMALRGCEAAGDRRRNPSHEPGRLHHAARAACQGLAPATEGRDGADGQLIRSGPRVSKALRGCAHGRHALRFRPARASPRRWVLVTVSSCARQTRTTPVSGWMPRRLRKRGGSLCGREPRCAAMTVGTRSCM